MKISAEQRAQRDENQKVWTQVKARNHANKLRQEEDQRKGLGRWMGMTSAARKALQDMDRLDKELAAMGAILLLSVLMASGQGYYVIEDTNQLRLIPSSVKVTYRTNLFEGETITFVVTNWSSVDDPKKLTLPNGTLAVMHKQEGRLMTNVEHRITFEGQTRTWKTLQTFSQPVDAREFILAAPPETVLATPTPLRQQR